MFNGDNWQARQGDILIIKIDKLPKKAKKRNSKILLKGESTGHAHRLEEGEIYEYNDRVLLSIPIPTRIIHEEHNLISIDEPGLYEIKRQREYQSKDMTRLVVD